MCIQTAELSACIDTELLQLFIFILYSLIIDNGEEH